MTRTTPARPVSVEAVFPELAPYRVRTTRLHPRPGRPGTHDSHVGGPMLWPDDEPWPLCHESHRSEDEGYAPDDIRSSRAAGARPSSRPWPRGEDGPVPFVALAQLFRRDIPGLVRGPGGADLVQLFRCPSAHGPYLGRRYTLRWRDAVKAFIPGWRKQHSHCDDGAAVHAWISAGKRATVAAGTYYVRPDIAYVPIDDAAPIEYAPMWRDGDRSHPGEGRTAEGTR